jgi:hypothetical protein
MGRRPEVSDRGEEAEAQAPGGRLRHELLVDRFWAPVGSGVQPQRELRFIARYLFSDERGRAAARRADETIRKLPGFATVRLQTVEGDPNYNIHRWLEAEGAEVYPAAITVWMDYLLRLGLQRFEDYSGIERHARLKLGLGRLAQAIYRLTVHRLRRAMGNLPHETPSQFELRRLAAPYFHRNLDGGEGDMLVGKTLWAYHKKKAHMICELSPYSCMPNTMSIGAMAGVVGRYPEILYAPLEIKGDAEVHALSRCQMILTEAKKRAQREFDEILSRTRLTEPEVRAYLQQHPEMKKATYLILAPPQSNNRR